jgi:hypothetical protein
MTDIFFSAFLLRRDNFFFNTGHNNLFIVFW